MPEYLAPGVYVEETSFRAPSIEGVGTSTAAFVGPTLTGPFSPDPAQQVDPNPPELLTSFGDFAAIYGGYGNFSFVADPNDAKNVNYVALSVKAFFDNGGSRLYVSRVFTPKAANDTGLATAGAVADDKVGLTARFPGSYLNKQTVTVTLNAVRTQQLGQLPPGSTLVQLDKDEHNNVTQSLFSNGAGGDFKQIGGGNAVPDPVKNQVYLATVTVSAPAASGATSVFEGLGLSSDHPLYVGKVLGQNPPRRIDALENQIAFVVGKNVTADKLFAEFFSDWSDATKTASKTYKLDGGNDGGAPVDANYENALKSLEALEDIAIVAAPGSSAYDIADAVVQSVLKHVERTRAYRVAILDTPPNSIASQAQDFRSKIDSTRAALYTPWVITANPLARPGTSIPAEISVPPSGFMAGIYARNDQQHSVAKAPANEVVLGALRFERNINFAEQGLLNPLGINCLRFFPGRGYRVWGARNATSNQELKYVNVRRYLVYLEHSIDNGTQWAVFENNGPLLWARVKESVEEFLYNEFAENNLLGTSPAEAYFVRCDRSTMTQNDLDNGRLICLIGVALLKPAEFVIFRIGQKTADARS
ncbi:MAG TPA: phage tail sheath subtilisin-like domain-containing protein [Terriglobales bacterium]|nr:phage tail sheath subtilisin-like domain-containing protein [Terriglobales bacterium]